MRVNNYEYYLPLLCIINNSVFSSGSLSIPGTVFGILGSLSLSLFSIYTKKTLPKLNQEVWLLSYYNNIYSSILFIPLIIGNNELNELIQYPNLNLAFWGIMTVGGICGFAIGWMTSMQIKVSIVFFNILLVYSFDSNFIFIFLSINS